jgi:acyl-CoA synthetase (AMP-forming)/AMP-acid ligase II
VSAEPIGYQAGETPYNNVINYLEQHARQTPARVALRWVKPGSRARCDVTTPLTPQEYDEITYGDLLLRVRATARGLVDLGLTKNDRVIIFLPMGLEMYTAMFAVQRIGAIAVFLDSWARRHHLGACVECVQPRAMISYKMAFDLIAGLPVRILAGPGNDGRFSAQLEELFQTSGEAELAAVASESPALITFTTGSSGEPKGANRTHRFLSAQHHALSAVIPYTAGDRDLPAFPIFSLNNIASGVTTVLPAIDLAQPSEQDGAILTHQLAEEQITCATLSVSMLNGVSRYSQQNGLCLLSLRRVVTGGAPVTKDEVRSFSRIAPQAEILVLYGSTEVEPIAHIEAQEMLAGDAGGVEEGVNVGRISPGLKAKFIRIVKGVVDFPSAGWRALEVAAGEVGELVVSGDHVCPDYYNNPDAFRRTKIVDHENQVWHRTGDLAYLDASCCLWLVGRVHNAILRGSRYYFPVSAEGILKAFPFVRQGAYLGLPDECWGERTAVVVALDPRQGMEPKGALAQIKQAFATRQIPIDSFYVVDEIPMDPRHHSKVEYGALRELVTKTDSKDWLL